MKNMAESLTLLRPWRITDKVALAENANNINIWNNVRDYFPHPYSEKDGEEFIQMVLAKPEPVVDFAIEVDGVVVGGIGVVPGKDTERISAEMGYWLGEKYWNKGIVSRAISEMVNYVFTELPITKLFAGVYSHNPASMRVLEKAGFVKEGILRKTAIKNGVVVDIHYYGLVKPD